MRWGKNARSPQCRRPRWRPSCRHAFDRHVRGRGVQKAGEGIGLNIVKRLCDLYGWQIDLANREGAGVVVSIRMD